MALTAVVTGASGYLAGECIHQLLAKGYNVRGTVTNVEDRRKTAPLLALRRALPGKLTLTEADLFEQGSFDDVVKGADYVFHTASNVIFDSSNPERDLIEPAVKGTSNVLRSVARNRKTVKRVIFSSSVAAIEKKIAGPDNGHLYTEDDWNNEATIDKYPYHLSKTLAEKLAWDLSTEYKFDLVSINPSFMLGPAVSAYGTSNSIMEMKTVLEGGEFNTLSNKLCDIRDGARAHILAAEREDAQGRYLVALKETVDHKFVTDILQRRFPEYEIYTGKTGPCIDLIDISRITKEFGMAMFDLEETIVDMAVSLIQLGIATPKLKPGF
jgi:nucleoside-diphosphate-sugar epimerase